MNFERAMGSRQDLKVDGCVPLFWNRLVCLDFLRGYIDCPKSQNILDKSLYTTLRGQEFGALLRANTLWKFAFMEPFRWLSGKTSQLKDWSLYKMCWVLDLVEKAMEDLVEDPSQLLDPNFDIFAAVAAEVPAFAEWRMEERERTVRAADGSVHKVQEEVLREAQEVKGEGFEVYESFTLELIKEQAQKALNKMRDPKVALADKLTSQERA